MKSLLSLFLLLPFALFSQTEIRVARIVSVYDGDTFRADITCDLPLFCENIPIRVGSVDTPEIRGKCAYEKVLAKRAREHTRIFLQSGGEIFIMNAARGKYFRLVSDMLVDGKSLSKSLLSAGLAHPYDGGKKKSWCEGELPTPTSGQSP